MFKSEDLIGRVIGNYRIISILGIGGMGIIYKAFDVSLERFVAIKFLSPQKSISEHSLNRFKQEAKNQAQLNHPNIVIVYGFIEYEGLLGIVMEYIIGDSLEDIIHRQERLSLVDSIYIVKQVLNAIEFAHSKGLIHRDIKPSNLLVMKDGTVKVMDFGISKSLFSSRLTKEGAQVGTVYYMSPEQIQERDLTPSTDIYSIGCTLYEMISGSPPYLGESEFEIMENHLKKEIPQIPENLFTSAKQLNEILIKCLAKENENRFSSCNEFIERIYEIEKHFSIFSKYTINRKIKSKSLRFFSLLILLIAPIFLIGVSYLIYIQIDSLLTGKNLEGLKKEKSSAIFSEVKVDSSFFELSVLKSNSTFNLNKIIITPTGKLWAFGENSSVIKFNDNDSSWQSTRLSTNVDLLDATFIENDVLWLVASNRQLIKYNYMDNLIERDILGESVRLTRIKMINDDEIFIIGAEGYINRTTNRGGSWQLISSGSYQTLLDIEFIDEDTGFIVGWSGTLLKTSDGGVSWKIVSPFTNKYLKSLDFIDKNFGVVVGGGGEILFTNDGGESWGRVNNPYFEGLNKVEFLNENSILIVGNKGIILFSDDKGEKWQRIQTGIFTDLNDFVKISDGTIFIIGKNGVILQLFPNI